MKLISSKEAADLIPHNCVLMMGGFLGCGAPHHTIDAMIEAKIQNLCLIGNDTAYENYGCGKLIATKQVKSLIASHIGTNKETGRQMSAGELEVVIVPQGTLVERIRAGGAGLGGILTPTGIGTDIQNGKDIIKVDGKEYLLEKPLRAEIALIYATYADKYGNLSYKGTTRNFNTVMALAADLVIVEVEEILDTALNPDEIIIPATCVDYIVDINKGK
ncbi:3-oxoacid CoA-transferase subunit A [Helicobacter muridarum]|uniref:3-oxoacid CoA-transferase subunit A n=1 Tax=Helicobacter muridarum TaxID=216 RepID=A0A099TZM5_9HELI|nr:3-oxoacid CoA-transferase subunit A [Helicobacter muridarum]TLE00575.1 3-oxoacid CoA-transferase subunit A [Helicobacter muridarum]STQ85587.1 succinyl-CoA:3-ketoacid-coenzyme A transferase subunit A [Helicobacter muridarum]